VLKRAPTLQRLGNGALSNRSSFELGFVHAGAPLFEESAQYSDRRRTAPINSTRAAGLSFMSRRDG
jgi:hypothetical protein